MRSPAAGARQVTHAAIHPEDPDRRLPRSKTATVIAEDDRLRLAIDSEIAGALPRTTTSKVHRSRSAQRTLAVTRCPFWLSPGGRQIPPAAA
jgi:hypothetical protein